MVKILAVLYKGGEYAKNQPKLLGTIENKLGIAEWVKEQGHELVVRRRPQSSQETIRAKCACSTGH